MPVSGFVLVFAIYLVHLGDVLVNVWALIMVMIVPPWNCPRVFSSEWARAVSGQCGASEQPQVVTAPHSACVCVQLRSLQSSCLLSVFSRREQSPEKSEEAQSLPNLTRSKKPNQPSKLIDLGAAATFANQAASQAQQAPVTTAPGKGGGSDPLADIFGDLHVSSGPAQASTGSTSQGKVWGTCIHVYVVVLSSSPFGVSSITCVYMPLACIHAYFGELMNCAVTAHNLTILTCLCTNLGGFANFDSAFGVQAEEPRAVGKY